MENYFNEDFYVSCLKSERLFVEQLGALADVRSALTGQSFKGDFIAYIDKAQDILEERLEKAQEKVRTIEITPGFRGWRDRGGNKY